MVFNEIKCSRILAFWHWHSAALHKTELWYGSPLGICFETCKEKMPYSISALHLTVVCSRASLLNPWVLQACLSFHKKHSPCPSSPFTLFKTPIRVFALASELWTIAAHVLKLSLTTEKRSSEGEYRYGVSWNQHRVYSRCSPLQRVPLQNVRPRKVRPQKVRGRMVRLRKGSGVLKVRHRKVRLYGTPTKRSFCRGTLYKAPLLD